MTREEAKERINNKHRNCTIKRIIDEIFDDFEKERRVQASIRNERLLLIKERIEAEAIQKCHTIIKKYKDAHKNLVKENRWLRRRASSSLAVLQEQ